MREKHLNFAKGLALVYLWGLVSAFALKSVAPKGERESIPTVTMERLGLLASDGSKPTDLTPLTGSFGEIGAFLITDIPGYDEAIADFQAKAPNCLKDHGFSSPMMDNSVRITFATDDSKERRKYPDCLGESGSKLSQVYDTIESYVSKIIAAGGMGSDENFPLLIQTDEVSVTDLEACPSKDNLHLYVSNEVEAFQNDSAPSPPMVPLHIDNGIFLIINNVPEHPMELQTVGGRMVRSSTDAIMAKPGILVLMGLGLTEWLLQERPATISKFYATPHSVPSMAGQGVLQRAVFARMKVAEDGWKPVKYFINETPMKTFGDIFGTAIYEESLHRHRQKRAENASIVELMSGENRGWHHMLKSSCEQGTAYCWMVCLPLPQECPSTAEAYCYSMEHNTPCGDDSMDTTCQWYCKDK